MSFKIIPFEASWIDAFLDFTDKNIGTGYYRLEDAKNILSRNQPHNTSFLLIDEESQIHGVRVSFPPGKWIDLVGPERLFLDRWPFAKENAGYFKSLFVDKNLQGQGWGPKLSAQSIEVMKKWGAEAVITHSWQESPNNSSTRYLETIGFKAIGTHKNFWSKIDYLCTGCHVKPCTCSADEMYKRI